MDALDRLYGILGEGFRGEAEPIRDQLTEIRVRVNRPTQLVYEGGDAFAGARVSPDVMRSILAALMDFSFHTRESELCEGFFTLCDGSRVGACGRMVVSGGRIVGMPSVASICIRVARPVHGCAEPLLRTILGPDRPLSTLLISPPGRGKTTMLREIARRLSMEGWNVAIEDERHELAACRQGIPTLDVGLRTDVMDGCPKAEAIALLVRAMAPDVIVTDEIGGAGDARALADAARCGVTVMASAHAGSFEALLERPGLRAALEAGVFSRVALLGDPPGTVTEIRALDAKGGMPAWRSA